MSNKEIEPTPQNAYIIKQYIEQKIKQEVKAKPQAQDLINEVKGIIIK